LSLFSQYIQERTNKFVLEYETGFGVYSYPNSTTVYLEDIYVMPEYRKNGIASIIANDIATLAKDKGCNKMIGSVVPSAKNSTSSLQVLLSYGMHLDSATNDYILFSKDLI